MQNNKRYDDSPRDRSSFSSASGNYEGQNPSPNSDYFNGAVPRDYDRFVKDPNDLNSRPRGRPANGRDTSYVEKQHYNDSDYTYSRHSGRYGRDLAPTKSSREEGGVWDSVKNFFGKGPKGYRRSDERIREEVCEALYRSPDVDASEIEVDVKNGEVTLSGTVGDRLTKKMAEDCADRISGVTDVRNDLRILTPVDELKNKNAGNSSKSL